MFEGVGFDLGETLVEYGGVPLNWESEYPKTLAAVATLWGDRLTPARIETGSAVLRCYNTRLAPRRHEVDGATVFGELLAALGVSPEHAPALLGPRRGRFLRRVPA